MNATRYVLQDLIAESKDGEWGKGEPFDGSVEMVVVRATDFQDVQDGRPEQVPCRFIPPQIAKRKTLRQGDIILETAGGGKDRPTGRTQLLRKWFAVRSPLPITCASFCRFIRIDPSKADPEYVYWLLQHLYSAGLMRQFHTQHTGVARFQYTTFATTLEFELPKRRVQEKVSSVLSAYDALIENNTRRITILESMAQALYEEWFVRFRFPGHESVPLVPSSLGDIPQGWRPTRLGELAAEVRRGVSPTELDPETPYIGLEHLPRRSITLGEWGRAGDVQSTKLRFQKGEILFGKIRPYFHKVGVAPVDGVASSDAIVIVPKKLEYFAPVLGCVSSDDFVSHATQTSQGTKMPRANWDVLVKYGLPLPPEPLLGQYNALIGNIVGMLNNFMLRNRNLRSTRDLLLPKLISGQIDLEHLDIDTGASVLEPVS